MPVLAKLDRDRFHSEMLIRLRSTFSDQLVERSDMALADFVSQQTDQPEVQRVVREGDVQRYLEIAVRFGADSYENPRYVWISGVLDKPDATGQLEDRLNRRVRAVSQRGRRVTWPVPSAP